MGGTWRCRAETIERREYLGGNDPPVPVRDRRGFLSHVWKGEFRFTTDFTCMASPCRAGDIRSRSQAGGAGRANSASLYRMAPVWPHGDKQVTVLVTLIAPARVSGQNSIRC